jgi:hypothetical protein
LHKDLGILQASFKRIRMNKTMAGHYIMIMSILAVGQVETTKDLLPILREGHLNSRAAIRSIHAKVYIEQTTVPLGNPKAKETPEYTIQLEWWQDGDMIRWTERSRQHRPGRPGQKVPSLIVDDGCINHGDFKLLSTQSQLSSSSPYRSMSIKAFNPGDRIGFDDLWSQALFVVPTGRAKQTLADFLGRPGGVREITKTTLGKNSSYRVRFTFPLGDQMEERDVWVDPGCNFLARKIEYWTPPDEKTFHCGTEVLSFAEVAPGIFFPRNTEGWAYIRDPKNNKERLLYRKKVRFESVVVNQRIEPKIFDIKIPAGTMVVDVRKGVGYMTGGDGQPGGPMVPAPIANQGGPSLQAGLRSPTRPGLWQWLACLVSLGALAATGAVLFRVRQKRLRAPMER